MNLNKVAKVESGYANKDRLLGSSANSEACSSKVSTSHKVDGVKKSSSNATKSWNTSYRRFLCSCGGSESKPSDPDRVSLVKKKKARSPTADSVLGLKIVKQSIKSDSRPSNNTSLVASHQVGRPCSTKKEIKSDVAGQTDKSKQSTPTLSGKMPPVPVMKRQIKKTADPKDPSIHNPKSTVRINQTTKHLPPSVPITKKQIQKTASPKDPPIYNTKSTVHINQTTKHLPPSVPVMKKQIHKTAGPKDPPIHNPKSTVHINQDAYHLRPSDLRTEVENFQVSKDSPVATQKGKIHKTHGSKVSMGTSLNKGILKPDGSKDSLIRTQMCEARRVKTQKTFVSKVPAAPVTKIGITKTSTTVPDKDFPSSSQYQPHLDTPVYYIRWDGDDMEPEVSGRNCMLCEKDLSCSPHGIDHEPREDDEYGGEYDDEYEFDVHFKPQLLRAVDILPCDHVFHSECSQHFIPDGKSTDPQCVFCLSMV